MTRRVGRRTRWLALTVPAFAVAACDPGAEVGFAPVDPLPTPVVEAQAAPWWPVDEGDVGPDTVVLDVLLVEQTCAGGELASGRVLPPVIETRDEAVVVTFLVEPVEGVVTCPSNPPTPAVLDLGEPLGRRELLDGALDPPRPPEPEG
jgi:hypothetical protein